MANVRLLALLDEGGRRRTLGRIRVGNLVFFSSLLVSPHVCNDNVTQTTSNQLYPDFAQALSAERVITVTTEALERPLPTSAKYSDRDHLTF